MTSFLRIVAALNLNRFGLQVPRLAIETILELGQEVMVNRALASNRDIDHVFPVAVIAVLHPVCRQCFGLIHISRCNDSVEYEAVDGE